MALPAAPARPGRGRPSNAQLTERLLRARAVNERQLDELRALRAECREFAVLVAAGAGRIQTAVAAGAETLAVNLAGEIGELAQRHVRQRNAA